MKVIWHHMMVATDEWPHIFGRPTDCWCEPEVDDLGATPESCGSPHRVVRHQDMTGKKQEVSNGPRAAGG